MVGGYGLGRSNWGNKVRGAFLNNFLGDDGDDIEPAEKMWVNRLVNSGSLRDAKKIIDTEPNYSPDDYSELLDMLKANKGW